MCGEQILEENAAEEHIIQNAIGGRIKAEKATCRKCNSRSGHQIDAPFCKKLAPIANMIDVERERGRNPNLRFKDDASGLQLKLLPGKEIEFDINYRKNDKDGVISFMLASTSNESEARRILKRDHPKLNPIRLQPKKLDLAPKYNFTTPGYELAADLRSVAKIMLCYARYVGLRVRKTCPMVQFLRGDTDIKPSIVAPQKDVLRFEENTTNYCGHSMSILYSPGCDFACCYLDLFSLIDYVGTIFIDEPPPSRIYTHRHDLINTSLDAKELGWNIVPEDVLEWLEAREFPSSRLVKRGENLWYWVARKPEIWMRRAIIKGFTSFTNAITNGVNQVEAKKTACALISKYMADRGYEVDMDNLSFEVVQE